MMTMGTGPVKIGIVPSVATRTRQLAGLRHFYRDERAETMYYIPCIRPIPYLGRREPLRVNKLRIMIGS